MLQKAERNFSSFKQQQQNGIINHRRVSGGKRVVAGSGEEGIDLGCPGRRGVTV